jgi:DNA replication protein DnaC
MVVASRLCRNLRGSLPNSLDSSHFPQLPVSRWHEQIGDPTIADGILDRLVHNAHRIEMRGESMRKNRNPPRDPSQE